MSFPHYPAYKDSGVAWLGEVPGHWGHVRVKHLFAIGRGRVISLEDANEAGTYPVYSSQTTNDGCLGYIETFDFDCDQITWTTDGANAGTVFLRRGKHNCTNVCGTLQVKNAAEIDLVFGLHYLAFATQFYKRPDTNGAKIMNGEMAEVAILVPPLPEQTQIAAFLDRETAKIDALVAEQRRLMALLREKRQAVISHAVTRGLNPHAPLKPSGIEWLGNVPAHWEVLVIKRFSTLQRGHDLTDSERTDGSYPVVTSSGINGTHGSFMARGPGVVTGRYGSTGRLFYIEDDFWPHNTSLYVSNFHGNHVRFVWYSLQTVDFAAHSAKAAVPGIDRNDIHVLPVVVPPKDEQAAIVTFLDSELAKLDTLTAEAQRAIDLLTERRTALISAAVTGQIDVRKTA